jgi:hypothetical protein
MAGAGGTAGSGAAGSAGSAGSAGAGGGTTATACDSAHALTSVVGGATYTGHAGDCVRLTVNPAYSSVNIQLQALPGTAGYPVTYTFSSTCAASGSGSLTADYSQPTLLKANTNPGCDFYVQFTGSATAVLKFTYFD